MLHINFYVTADATIYVGGLDEKVTEALLWELFLQAGPVGELLHNMPNTLLQSHKKAPIPNFRYKVHSNIYPAVSFEGWWLCHTLVFVK